LTPLSLPPKRIGLKRSDDRLQELSEGKQRVSADLGHRREVMLGGRGRGHPSGHLQGRTGRIDNREASIPMAWLAQHVELLSVPGMKRIVDRDFRTCGFMDRAVGILKSMRW
jgi:hypothetical protein